MTPLNTRLDILTEKDGQCKGFPEIFPQKRDRLPEADKTGETSGFSGRFGPARKARAGPKFRR